MWGDRGLRELVTSAYNEVLEAEMTEHLGTVRSTSALIAVGVNEAGYREILGIRIANSETEEGWLETFRWLKGRGLEGVELVVSDALERLIQELRRREKVTRIFPNDESAWRLLRAVLAETHEDGATGRRCFRMGDYFRWRRQQQAAGEDIQPAA